jgi:circadian clock protein KaiB
VSVIVEPERSPETVVHRLTLYVHVGSDISRHAVAGTKAMCDSVLAGHYVLEVLDLQTNAATATAHGVVATPTLVVTDPPPLRRYVGDLSDSVLVAQALGLALPDHRRDSRSSS